MQGRHETVFGFKGNDIGARKGLAFKILIQAGLHRHNGNAPSVGSPSTFQLPSSPWRTVASLHLQSTRFAYSFLLRNALMAANGLLAGALGLGFVDATVGMGILLVSLGVSALIGRALFYVLVIPTTMPGGFFWKNKGFEEHARTTGLADRERVGVAPSSH